MDKGNRTARNWITLLYFFSHGDEDEIGEADSPVTLVQKSAMESKYPGISC